MATPNNSRMRGGPRGVRMMTSRKIQDQRQRAFSLFALVATLSVVHTAAPQVRSVGRLTTWCLMLRWLRPPARLVRRLSRSFVVSFLPPGPFGNLRNVRVLWFPQRFATGPSGKWDSHVTVTTRCGSQSTRKILSCGSPEGTLHTPPLSSSR